MKRPVVFGVLTLVLLAFVLPAMQPPAEAVTWAGVSWTCGTCGLGGTGAMCGVCELALALWYRQNLY